MRSKTSPRTPMTPGRAGVVVAALLLVGCGRIGFDEGRGEDGGTVDATLDAGDADARADAVADAAGDAATDADAGGPDVWPRVSVGDGRIQVQDLVVDGSGAIYLTGYFDGTANFGDGDRASVGERDAFVVSYEQTGAHRFTRTWGSATRDEGEAVLLDSAGDLWVTGFFTGMVDFGGGTKTSAGGRDVFLMRMSRTGEYQASFAYGGAGDDGGGKLARIGLVDVVLVGSFGDTIDFGSGMLSTGATAACFVALIEPSGSDLWSRAWGDVRFNACRGVAVASDGSIYTTGFYEGMLDFGGGAEPYRGIQDAFVLALTEDGVYRWSRTFGASGFDYGNDVAVDDAGNLYVSGYFEGTADIDPGGGTLTGQGSRDIFIVSYDRDGVVRWQKSFGGAGCDEGRGVITTGSTFYFTGAFEGPVDFGGGSLVTEGADAFVVALDTASGTHRWSVPVGTPGADIGRAVGVLRDGRVVVAAAVDGDDTGCGTATRANLYVGPVGP
jgi:hypothetical protein